MDDKLLDMKMEEHLSNTRWDIRVALQRFEQIGVKIDRKFRREFIKKTNDWWDSMDLCVFDEIIFENGNGMAKRKKKIKNFKNERKRKGENAQ